MRVPGGSTKSVHASQKCERWIAAHQTAFDTLLIDPNNRLVAITKPRELGLPAAGGTVGAASALGRARDRRLTSTRGPPVAPLATAPERPPPPGSPQAAGLMKAKNAQRM